MLAVARSTCISRSIPLGAKENIYYLLSIIHYLLSKVPGCASGFCPSAPLGVTFVGCDKSNQKHAFKYGARGNQNDGFAGEKPHFASIAPTVKVVLRPPCLRVPLSSANRNGEWELIYALKTYSNYFSSRGFLQKDKI